MDEGPKDSKLGTPPRGASPAEQDHLRAVVKVAPRPNRTPTRMPRPTLPPPPTHVPQHQALPPEEVNRIIDEGRALLDQDRAQAHQVFEKAYRRNLNDVRVLSNYGLTLVLVEGDRQRGIRFCEEAVRRGPLTTEMLVNLARALVVTRNKEQAVRALQRALELAPNDPRVRQEFLMLGLRRPPPIPWLPRNFFLNRWLGKLTWRLSGKRFDPTLSFQDLPEAEPEPQALPPRQAG
ncbi:MAG TPA: tetratricopeptide repeat protein [Myxococcales bacterium]|nr:tetratricopeptide repeat protein [Myxococcales bacterium]